MKTNAKRIVKYLIAFLIVISGVFLGVYANEIQSEKRIKKEKEQSTSYIIEELNGNQEKLARSIKYHQAIRVEVDSIAKV